MLMRAAFLTRLDARDRALFARWVFEATTPKRVMRTWRALTHVGGLRASIAAIFIPAALGDAVLRTAAMQAALALLLSHLVVQLIKRSVVRERPTMREVAESHVLVPDKFSFPSGHSCSVMSIAMVYTISAPHFSVLLLLLASLVGFSRVRLGVHYPGDVIVGQVIAIATAVAVVRVW